MVLLDSLERLVPLDGLDHKVVLEGLDLLDLLVLKAVLANLGSKDPVDSGDSLEHKVNTVFVCFIL